jgi:outer membrane lipoprotein-sorting protein
MRPTYFARVCLGAVALVFIPALATAQTVDEIVSKHIAARGGMDRIKAIHTLKIIRTVATGIGSNVRVIVYKKRPNLYRGEQGPTTAGASLTPRGVNADDAWDIARDGKIVLRPEPAGTETRELDADFDGLLVDWKEKGHTVTYDGRQPMPGGDVFVLRVKTKGGSERSIYLDATTYLDRRHTGVLTLPNARRDVVMDFSNWQDVNGVKFPFDINEDRTGGPIAQSLVTYTEKIEANVPMADSLFATPKGGAQD